MSEELIPAIHLESISRSFPGNDQPALHKLSLKIEAGEFVAIIGPSGSGKSTLMNVLGLLDHPSSGKYWLFGQESTATAESSRNRIRAHSIGFIFQASHILGDDSVLSNAAMGLRTQSVSMNDRTQAALDAIDRLGLAHRVGATAKTLSGGERQRLAIARAVATGPQIILADEPTGNLDSVNSAKVVSHLRMLNSTGSTIVVITHDPQVAAAADRQIEILDGQIVYDSGGSARNSHSLVSPLQTEPLHDRSMRSLLRIAADDAGDAISSLAIRGLRSLLLVLAFAIGVGGLVASVALSETTSNQVSSAIKGAALDEVKVNLGDAEGQLFDQREQLDLGMDRISDLPHVRGVAFLGEISPTEAKITRLSPTETEPDRAISLATSSSSYFDVVGIDTTPLRASVLLDGGKSGSIAIVSKEAAEELGIDTSGVGGPPAGISLWINGQLVQVVGYFSPDDRTPELQVSVIVSPEVVAGIDQMRLSLVVRTEEGFPSTVSKAVPFAFSPASPGSVSVQTVADLQDLRVNVANDLGTFIAVLSIVLILLAAISAATAMYLTVQSRSSEIALRRAIGASRSLIFRLFLLEGLMVGSIGGLLGGAIGTLFTLVISASSGWTPVLPPTLTGIGLSVGAVTGVVSSIYPAWLASRKDPANAIRS